MLRSITSRHFRKQNPLIRTRVLFAFGLMLCALWGLGIKYFYPEIELNWVVRSSVYLVLVCLFFLARLDESSVFYYRKSILWGCLSIFSLIAFETMLSQWHTVYVLAAILVFVCISNLAMQKRDLVIVSVAFLVFFISSIFFPKREASDFLIYFGLSSALAVGVISGFERFDFISELQNLQQRNNGILASIAEGFVLTDAQGKIISFNDSAEKILQINFKAATESNMEFPWDWRTVVQTKRKLLNREVYWKSKSEVQVIRMNLSPLLSETSEVLGVICLFYDVTDIREVETRVKEQRELLETNARISSLGEMSASIAHEINNPLSIISGQSFFLRQLSEEADLSPREVLKSLDRIDETVRKISQIVRSMKSLARNGEYDSFEVANVREIVDQTLVVCRQKLKLNNVQLIVEVPEELFIRCRPVQIAQVLLNMVTNAMDAIKKHNQPWVKISAKLNLHHRVEIAVEDSGFGISKSIEHLIMRPFFTTKPHGEGTGLGLSISKTVIEAHDGKFYYDRMATHTRFVMEVPQAVHESALEA